MLFRSRSVRASLPSSPPIIIPTSSIATGWRSSPVAPMLTPSPAFEPSSQAVALEEIAEQLEKWRNRCVVCYGGGRHSRHPVEKCTSQAGRAAVVQAQKWTVGPERIKVQGHVGLCYCCSGPISICGQKQFKGVAIALIVGVQVTYPAIWAEWWSRVQSSSGISQVQEIPQWIGGQSKSGYGRLIDAFMWMVQYVEGQSIEHSSSLR